MTENINLSLRSLKANNWSAKNLKYTLTSMSWHLSPCYGHVTLVSGYLVLTSVN